MKAKFSLRLLVFVVALATLVGCAAPQSNVPPSEPPQSTASITSEPIESAPERIEPTPEESSGGPSSANDGEIRIRMTFEGGEAILVLTDNPTTQSLLAQLPATLIFEDFASAEKIAHFPEKLSREDAPEGYDPELGDVACYGPWGNLALFYGDQPYAAGLIPMGHFESGLDAISSQGDDFEASLDVINQ